MTYNLKGKRTSLENLAGQVTTTAWDCCHKVSETQTDGATTTWDYDDDGRMISSSRLIPLDMTNVTWLTTCYRYDDFSRLVSTTVDYEPTTEYTYDILVPAEYTANNLNQYTSISNSATSALSASPRENFTPQFDDDGNQILIKTSTGIWSVTYNGENRPILWTCTQSNNQTITNNQTISMSYDRMGRRVAKNTQRFVYDGFLQIANYDLASTNLQLTAHNSQLFIWDPTEPIATRPLVWNFSAFQPSNSSTYYYTHDGNKNVSEAVATDGMVSAHYGYTPFGSLLVMHGESALSNCWRFSSEYADDETGTGYYNYRHYNSFSGSMVSRDLIEEVGGMNLYSFCCNQCENNVDYLGLAGSVTHGTESCNEQCDNCFELSQKVNSWMEHYKERHRELREDKHGLRTSSPVEYENHLEKLREAEKNINNCLRIMTKKCRGLVYIPVFYPKPLPAPAKQPVPQVCIPRWVYGTGAAVCGTGALIMFLCPLDGPAGEVGLGAAAAKLLQMASSCPCAQ